MEECDAAADRATHRLTIGSNMLNLLDISRASRVLLVGAHSDDIEIGCGGTLLHPAALSRSARLTWVVFCGSPQRQDEAKQAAERFARDFADLDLRLFGLRDAYLPYLGAEVKDRFETLKDASPDLIFTHRRDDLHQDHALLNRLTWNTFRDHTILEYEIAKFDADLGQPNVFVPLDESVVAEKCRLLSESFASQRSRQWFDHELFRGLMRLRGVECNSPTRFAEAFTARKLTV